MDDYQIVQPSLLLTPYVKHYWFLKANSVLPTEIRTVPTGHICLIFHRGERIFSTSGNKLQYRSFLSGNEKVYNNLLYSGTVDMISVVFKPMGAKVFFDFPMDELGSMQVDINDLGDRELSDLGELMIDTTNNQMCVLKIEQFLLKRINNLAEYNLKRLNTAIQLINSGQTNVGILADVSCLSYKQFKRVFSEYTGANPKDFLRTIRFQKALYLLQMQPYINLAHLAFECGYYDQPHLIKEFKIFSGYTPVEYMAVCDPYSDYFS